MYRTEIVYDPETRDYRMEIEGEPIGFTPTHREATVALGRLKFDLTARGEQPAKASWSTVAASADDPPTPLPDDLPAPGPGGPGVPGDDRPRITLQTMLATQQQGLCINCGGTHRTWACPEIARALFAPEPWKDIALGRELCRMRWRRYPAFVALLKSVYESGHLLTYAASYQAYIRSHSPQSDLTIGQVVEAWGRIIGTPAIEQAA